MKNKNTYIVLGGFIALIALLIWNARRPSKLDEFAKCLKENGATFYGAFWCPHCQNQKRLFGRSQKYLPYVECSTTDGRAQKAECTKKNIEGYPTWEFADGSRMNGEVSLQSLSEKTNCPLP